MNAAKARAKTQTADGKALLALQKRRMGIQRRGRRMGGSVEQLQAIAAGSKVKVTKLPAGTHSGWKPSWAP
jgi:hypothetical protein